jgi:MoaA/NifB/PqqE/SkfB family radical SAM enzyme
LRPDIYDIGDRAKALGFSVSLSSNGALIDDAHADRIAGAGFDYVGVSLDGIGAVHDRFRGRPGSFDASIAGIRRLGARGVKVGLRFTMTTDNQESFPLLLDLMRAEGATKFYLSHLVYSGRGNKNRTSDAEFAVTRDAMHRLFEVAWADVQAGSEREYVTGNNDADGAFLWMWVNPRRRIICAASSPNGAATPPASTSPTSTISGRSTPTPSGGTTRSATCWNAPSATSGPTPPTR